MAYSKAAAQAKIRAAIRQAESRQKAELRRVANKIRTQTRGRVRITIR